MKCNEVFKVNRIVESDSEIMESRWTEKAPSIGLHWNLQVVLWLSPVSRLVGTVL